MISIPDDELARIDDEVARRGTSRSALLREAALCDTNVVMKWFHDEPGDESLAARQIALASEDGAVELRVIDLTYYETANVLRRSGRSAAVVSEILAHLHEVCGPGIVIERRGWAEAADVSQRVGLTFYDAAYVAVASRDRMTLVTADTAMITAGGVLPSTFAQTLGVA